jgi:beta-lactamase regulating signal transducer with metallopeptidase domain
MNAMIESLNAWGARFAGFALPMLLQSAVLIALLLALDFVLRNRVRATIRYAFWMLVLVKLVLPPTLTLPTGAAYWLPPQASAALPDEMVVARVAPIVRPASEVRGAEPLVTSLPPLRRRK